MHSIKKQHILEKILLKILKKSYIYKVEIYSECFIYFSFGRNHRITPNVDVVLSAIHHSKFLVSNPDISSTQWNTSVISAPC